MLYLCFGKFIWNSSNTFLIIPYNLIQIGPLYDAFSDSISRHLPLCFSLSLHNFASYSLLDRILYSHRCTFFSELLVFSIVYRIIEKSHQEDVTAHLIHKLNKGNLKLLMSFHVLGMFPLLAFPMLEASRDTALR